MESSANSTTQLTLELAPNEFLAHDNKVGIYKQEPEPVTFFSIEKKEYIITQNR